MKIGVIHPDSGWILSTIAKSTCQAMPDVFYEWTPTTISMADPKAVHMMDAWYYVDVQNCWNPKMKTCLPQAKHVGMFTHLDEDSNNSFRVGWEQLDGVIHMCERYSQRFLEAGWYGPGQMTVLRPGDPCKDILLKPVNFGICQRGGFIGKGSEFLPAVLNTLPQDIKDAMELYVCGSGWGYEQDYQNGFAIWNGVYTNFYFEDFYRIIPNRCDYLFIPSLWEGGPMGMLEAMAAGIPVISADVGWVREFIHPENLFQPGDVGGAANLIGKIVDQRLCSRALVEKITYANYARDVLSFIEGLEVER